MGEGETLLLPNLIGPTMAFSVVRYTGNFSQTNFAIPFGYMVTSHIKVTVAGVQKTQGTDYTVSGGTLTFTTAPAMGETIIIRRDSSQAQLMTDYQDGVTLTKGALSVDSSQAFYMAQEALDGFGSGEQMNLSLVGSFWDAQGRQIKNLGTPTEATDAATKGYVDGAISATISGSGYVQKVGDTMTGPLVLPGNPTLALQAAPKQYVDAVAAAIPTVPSGNWAPLGGMLVARPYAASKYAWIQYLNAGGANPFPTTNVPAVGTNGQSISYFMSNNMGKHDITNTTAAISAFTTVAASWPVTPMTNHWVFVPVMFDKTTTVSYIGTPAFQTSTSKYGQLRMQIFACDSTTLAPSTMLRDCGTGTLASLAGGVASADPPVGTVIFVSTGGGYTFTAGTQYFIGVCYGYSDGSTTIGISYQIGTISPGANTSRLWATGNYLPTTGSTLLQLASFWVGSSGPVQHTVALGDNPACTNVVSWASAMVLPHLYFST